MVSGVPRKNMWFERVSMRVMDSKRVAGVGSCRIVWMWLDR